MTKVILLEQLKYFTQNVTKDLILPVAQQPEDKEPPRPRAARVYRMHLTNSRAAMKNAPYILHQIITGKDIQPPGRKSEAYATIRTICCVYHPDEQEGGLALLGLMERLRIALLEENIVGSQL